MEHKNPSKPAADFNETKSGGSIVIVAIVLSLLCSVFKQYTGALATYVHFAGSLGGWIALGFGLYLLSGIGRAKNRLLHGGLGLVGLFSGMFLASGGM